MNTKEIIESYALKLKDDNIYIAPNIPENKIANALKSFAKGVNADEPLLLIDETVFGSSKDGLILTKNTIYAKSSFEKPISFELNKITKIDTDSKFETILFNGYEFAKFTTPDKKARIELIALLKELSQSKSISPSPIESSQDLLSNIKIIEEPNVNENTSPTENSSVKFSLTKKIELFTFILVLIGFAYGEFFLFNNYSPEYKDKLTLLLFEIPVLYGLPLAGVGLIMGMREKLAIYTSNFDVFLTGIVLIVNIIPFVVLENSLDPWFRYTAIFCSIILNIAFLICSYLANKNFLLMFVIIPTKIWCVLILLLLSLVTIGYAIALKENLEEKKYKKALGSAAGTLSAGYSTVLVDRFLHQLVKKGKEINQGHKNIN